jgi:hypothetical protein
VLNAEVGAFPSCRHDFRAVLAVKGGRGRKRPRRSTTTPTRNLPQAFSWYNWGSSEPVTAHAKRCRHVETPLREHHRILAASDLERCPGIAQSKDPAGELHSARIPQQTEIEEYCDSQCQDHEDRFADDPILPEGAFRSLVDSRWRNEFEYAFTTGMVPHTMRSTFPRQ